MEAWADGEMERWREEEEEVGGTEDGGGAAAFISGKLIPLFAHLAPSDKTGCGSAAFSFFHLHSCPSFNCDGFISAEEREGALGRGVRRAIDLNEP